ncbi:MAG: ABC transporter ATP-binding protein [Ruminococcus sp.]|nr:ABC transporter ATP-binding protein [Ruminococcus sp.]
MSDALLSIKNLSAGYGDFVAIDSVDLAVKKGQIVSLIGINGAGKTTLMHTVAGLHKPASGKVLFGGEDITGLSADKIVAKGLSLVPQGGRCFTRMSVQDNLLMGSFPRSARKNAKQTLEHIYELFPDLGEMKQRPAGNLSGGQRQMVAIGRALMGDPECLIFDEISLGLSPAVINDIYKKIKRINEEENTSIILIEQDIRRALKASDAFYVMLKGRVALSGQSDEIDSETLKKAYFGI